MSDVNAGLRSALAAATQSGGGTHSAVRGLIHKQFREADEVKIETTEPGVVEVTVKPRWLEPAAVRFLNASDMVPAGVAFEPGNPMTSFNLKPGLTVIAGMVASGKTTMLLWVGNELRDEKCEVECMVVESIPHGLLDKHEPKFHICRVDEVDEVFQAAKLLGRGDALLVDGFDQLNPAKPDDGIAGRNQRLNNVLRQIGRTAEQSHAYVVVTIQTRRPLANSSQVEVVLPNGIAHSFPILKVFGDR